MKRLIATLVLCVTLMGAAVAVDPNEPIGSFYESMSCEEVTELYGESARLFRLAESRLEHVKTTKSKFFWLRLLQFTASIHDPLLIRQGQVCKRA